MVVVGYRAVMIALVIGAAAVHLGICIFRKLDRLIVLDDGAVVLVLGGLSSRSAYASILLSGNGDMDAAFCRHGWRACRF